MPYFKNSLLLKNKMYLWDFSGVTVDRKLPANAEDMGLLPNPGRPHMPQSN